MATVLDKMDRESMRYDVPEFRTGDTVSVYLRIIEGAKERIQVFKGVVLGQKRGKMGASFTVRKMSHGIGVEKSFPLHSPKIKKIVVDNLGRVRRSKLYYLRELRGKAARIKERKLL